ncbi:MAG: enterotoxin, partial [Planctomycetes bacterium]|nr:enterotoxin [Planctomycetota bacterium]
NPDVFINVTAGTWPSPFWLNHVDCTWRGDGGDVGWLGKGDDREQWLTFRDHYCYRNVVTRAPLYPLNSIMHHGIVHGRAFQGARVAKAGSDLKNEARSYFGAGPTMQELYLTPSMMTEASWRQVGEAAQWAHANADVLLDSHWVGGDPAKLEPYGYASWSPRKGTLTLRNPDDVAQTFALDIQKVLELPTEAPRTYRLKNAFADQKSPEAVLTAGKMHAVTLRPFEVLVFDVEPLR